MRLLTSGHVSLAVSFIIVFLCALILFLSGYVLQQRTLRDLREAIRLADGAQRPPIPPAPPLPYLKSLWDKVGVASTDQGRRGDAETGHGEKPLKGDDGASGGSRAERLQSIREEMKASTAASRREGARYYRPRKLLRYQ
ncbi:hypothetical protein VTJ83DRAFT_1740 [Remersonia thermophila]|uniref:Uncharacterized protein n=1 Tax=Remersonia thermophila TaxID=72144 RepID=A0ABR4DIA6_9PEZI